MRLAALISGGKDSLYATYLASNRHEIRVLVAIKIWNEKKTLSGQLVIEKTYLYS